MNFFRLIAKRFLVALSLVLLAGCGSLKSAQFVGKEAPYARMTMFNGDIKLLDSYRGRPVVLGFWSTSCQYSNPVIEELDQLAQQYRKNGVAFVGVSLDTPSQYDTLKMRVTGPKLNHLEHAFSGNEGLDELFLSFGGDSLPMVIMIDANGTVLSMTRDASQVRQYLGQRYG